MFKNVSFLQRFRICASFVMVCALMIGSVVLLDCWERYSRGQQALANLLVYREVLRAANLISAERGPSNSVLGQPPTEEGAAREKLRAARAASDAALDSIDILFASGGPEVAQGRAIQGDIRLALATGRGRIDALRRRPPAERDEIEIRLAIGAMFDVITAIQPLIDMTEHGILANGKELAGEIMMARLLGEIREYAGRIGSLFMPSIAARRPIDKELTEAIARIRGRIQELWFLVNHNTNLHRSSAEMQGLLLLASQDYFVTALSKVDELLLDGQASGNYPMTTMDFTDFIVPKMRPLEQLRDLFLDSTEKRATAARDVAWAWMVVCLLAIGLIAVILLTTILAIERQIFRPLLSAIGEIIAIATGNAGKAQRQPPKSKELRVLFEALDALRESQRIRDALEAERRELSAELRRQAVTDGLTGLLNRRALDEIGRDVAHADASPGVRFGVILFDIDHFKTINDTYGHLVGDRVLQQVAHSAELVLDPATVFARFGGEEFAILVRDCDSAALAKIAEDVRRALAGSVMAVAPHAAVSVTASFGVAAGLSGKGQWETLLKMADKALYRAKRRGRNCVAVARGGMSGQREGVPSAIGAHDAAA